MENELPEGWVWSTLGEVADWASGGTPKSTEARYYGGEIPWLIIGDLNDAEIHKSKKTITNLGLQNSSAKLVPIDSVLCAMYGSIGKLGIAKIRCATNQAIAFTEKIHGDIPHKYIFYYLMAIRQQLFVLGKGGAQQNISQSVLKNVPIPIAPRNEQERIVAKLDALMEKIERSKARLEKMPSILKRFRQSVLAAAVSGKLTEEWRNQNPGLNGTSLLNHAYRERISIYQSDLRLSNVKSSRKPMRPIEYFEHGALSYGFPTSWAVTCPEMIASPERYSLAIGPFGSNLKVADYQREGVPLVFVRNIKRNDFHSDAKFVAKKKARELAAHSISALDLVITKMGEPPGDCEVYPNESPDAIITADCLKFRVWDKYFDRTFFKHVINSTFIKEQLGLITQGVAQQKISLKRFKTLHMPIPSLQEQEEIVRRVDELFEVADKLEKRYDVGKSQMDKLPQSILAKAFRGELVSQDADEILSVEASLGIKVEPKRPRSGEKVYELKEEMSLAAEPKMKRTGKKRNIFDK